MKILSQAPSRISLFGGGTDIVSYSDLYGGICINLAINLRSYFTLFTDEDMYDPKADNSVPYLGKKEFIYAFTEEFGINDMHLSKFSSEFDGILESGIGSSASSAVAILGAINKYQNLGMSKSILAERAWQIEIEKLGLFGGKQDQYIACYGGFNFMQFEKDGIKVISFDKQQVESIISSLVLFYTGKNRKSATIQEGFKNLSKEQIGTLNIIKNIAIEAVDPIITGNYIKLGALLEETWEFKKLSNKGVTNSRINMIYNHAKECGAYGGKIMGAGGGGYMVFIVNPKEKEDFIEAMEHDLGIENWDFSIDFNGLEVRDITNK